MAEVIQNPDNPRRKLITDLIKTYEPDVDITPDYLDGIEKHYGQDNDKLVTDLIHTYEKDVDITPDYLSGIYDHYGVKKKDLSTADGGIPSSTTTPSGEAIAKDITLAETEVAGNKGLVEDVNFTGPLAPGSYMSQSGQAVPVPAPEDTVDPSKNQYGNSVLNTLADAGSAFYNNLVASAPKMLGNTIKYMANMQAMKMGQPVLEGDVFSDIQKNLTQVSKNLEAYQSPESQDFKLADVSNPKKLVPAIFAAGGQMSQMLLAAPAGGNVAGAIGGMQGLSSAYETAKNANLSETDATTVAGIIAPAAFLLEKAGLDFTKAAPAVVRNFVTDVIKETGEKVTQASVVQAVTKVLPKVVKQLPKTVAGGLGEGITEGLQSGVELGVQAAYDATAGEGKPAGQGNFGTANLTLGKALEQMAADAVIGTIVGAGAAATTGSSSPTTPTETTTSTPTPVATDAPEVQAAKQGEVERLVRQVVEGTKADRNLVSQELGVDVENTDLNELGALITDYVNTNYTPDAETTTDNSVPAPDAAVPDTSVPGEPESTGDIGTQPSPLEDAPDQPVGEGSDIPTSEVATPDSDKAKKKGITVFHGSPHQFDIFDMSKVGTGEGNQAFGYGMYFTNDEKIAKGYATGLSSKKNFWDYLADDNALKLTRNEFSFIKDEIESLGFDGELAERSDLGDIDVDGETVYAPDVLDALSVLFGKNAEKELSDYDLTPEQINRLLEVKKKISNPQFYKVTLHNSRTDDDVNYLGWEENLSDKQYQLLGDSSIPKGSGKEIYNSLVKKLGSQKAASEFLSSKGFDGIVYKSVKGTGGADGQGRNFVVFDPKEVNIEEINGQAIRKPQLPTTVQVNKATYTVTKATDGTYNVINALTGQPLNNIDSQNYKNAIRLYEEKTASSSPTELPDIKTDIAQSTNEPINQPIAVDGQITDITRTDGQVMDINSDTTVDNGQSLDKEVQVTPDNRKERQYTKKIIEDPETPAERKARITDAARYYPPRTNNADIAEADRIILEEGLEKATNLATDENNGLDEPVHNILLYKLESIHNIKGDEAFKAGDLEKSDYHNNQADKLEELLAIRGTGFAQGLQSFRIFSKKTPQRHLNSTRKMVRKQRDKALQKHKKTTDRQKKAIKQGNEEAVAEVLADKAIRKEIEKAASIEGELGNSFEWVIDKTGSKPSTTYGSKNKVVKQDKYEAAKKRLRGKFYSTPMVDPDLIVIGVYHIEAGSRSFADFAKRMVADLGRNIKPHLRDIYKSASDQLTKEGTYKESDFDNDDQIADTIAKDDAYILAQRIFNRANKKSPVKFDPVKAMLDTLFKKVDEKLTPRERTQGLSALEKIALAVQQQEKYKQVWDESKKLVTARIEADTKLTDEEKALLNTELDAYYKEVIGKSFSDKQVAAATKKGIKDLDQQIAEIVKQHYTVAEKAKRTLTDKLVADAGLSMQQAGTLARAIQEQFDVIATKKKKQLLSQKLTIKERVNKKKTLQLHEQIIELSNLGALSDAEFTELYVKKMELPHLTGEQTAKIMELANKVQEAEEGRAKNEAAEELLAYQTNLKGVSMMDVANSIWYANVLSGFTTQEINFFANLMEAAGELTTSMVNNPKNTPHLLKGLYLGYGRGALEALRTLQTGKSPVRGKVEVPNVLERINFKGGNWNPFNYYKYVQRIMMAADTFSYQGIREMRAYELAATEARKEGKDDPTKSIEERINEKLFRTKERVAEAKAQAEQEGLKGKAFKRRVLELMDQSRDVEMRDDMDKFASMATFNYDPEGSLGLVTDGVAKIVNSVQYKGFAPLRYIVPFTRIIANVTNRYLDYFPIIGYTRWAKGGIGFEYDSYGKKFRKYTPDERRKEFIKASLGSMAMLFFFLASDEEDGFLEITSNGTGSLPNNYELQKSGWQKYSVKVGDTWYSYMNTPLAIPLSLIGNVRDNIKYGGQSESDDMWDVFGGAMFKSMQYVTDMTFLKGVSEFMGSFNKENPMASANYWKRFAASTIKGYVVPNLLTQTTKEYQAANDIPMKEGKTFTAYLVKDLPIARNSLNDMVDALGDPIIADTDRLTSETETDPVWDLIIKNEAWIGRVNQKTLKYFDPTTETERQLTDDEYYIFAKKRGQLIKEYILENMDDLQSMSKGEVQDFISRYKPDATDQAKAYLNEQGL